MYKYLERNTTMFCDPHGSEDEGKTILRIIETDYKFNTSLTYFRSMEYVTEEHYCDALNKSEDEDYGTDSYCDLFVGDDFEPQGSEDGYNSTTEYYHYSLIKTDEDAILYDKTIRDYNSLLYFSSY